MLHAHMLVFAETHDRALAELLFKLLDRGIKRCLLIHSHI